MLCQPSLLPLNIAVIAQVSCELPSVNVHNFSSSRIIKQRFYFIIIPSKKPPGFGFLVGLIDPKNLYGLAYHLSVWDFV
jgi:hypothetical protein